MKKLCIITPLVLSLVGCSSLQPAATTPPPEFTTLGVPLDSEAGQLKLLVLEYLSETLSKNDSQVRFVPLSEAEIQQVRSRFRHELRPGAEAEYTNGSGMVDKATRQSGVGILIRDVRLNGEEADIEAGYYTRATGESTYNFRLVRINGAWRIHDYVRLSTTELTNPVTVPPTQPARRF